MPPPLTPKLDGLEVEQIEIDHSGSIVSVGLFILRSNDRLTARLNYDPDLFEPATAARILQHFRDLLESVVADPEQSLSELPLPIRPSRVHAPRVDTPPDPAVATVQHARNELRRAATRALRRAGQLRAWIKERANS